MEKKEILDELYSIAKKIDSDEVCSRLVSVISRINLNMFSIDQIPVRLSMMVDQPTKEEKPKDLGPRIYDLEVSIRLLNCIRSMKEFNPDLWKGMDWMDVRLGHFEAFSRKDLLKFRNFGKKSLMELEDEMAKYGFKLRD